ncbi:uncharacterized protein LOC128865687 [Anastrepha ludens]|uniref:uncharacterized protein LOC128865687 n=1 Tax=Anastrepha ludens TaxID=28586 RepID=UPI0023AFB204|nr:uncharacterized protein LOC128865687 [Anastrepha ludens]
MNTSLNTTSPQEFWVEFIELYKSLPVLWKYGSEVYKDRQGKKRAYLELVKKMREVDPTATVDTVKKKINSLRSCYRRKRYKAQEDIKLGMQPKIKWVYFDHFNFLRECKETSKVEEDSWEDYCEDSSFSRINDDNSAQTDGEESDTTLQYDREKTTTTPTYQSPSPSSNTWRNDSIDMSYQRTSQPPNEEADIVNMALKITAQHKFWIEFIKLYRSKPELWKTGSEVYKDREAKNSAYLELAEKMREIYPNADVDMVKRKINSLRSIYRRKLHKTKRAIRLGKRPENKWVYFDHFSFLHECKDPLEEDDDWNHCEDSRFDKLDDTCDNTLQNNADEEESIVEMTPPKNNTNRAYGLPAPSSKRICTEPRGTSYKQVKQFNDEADIVGISWAYQYRSLTDTQKLFAKKAIDDILFEARLETLHRNSVRINSNNCSKCKMGNADGFM